MPRAKFNYKNVKLNRTVGLEIEGYMKESPNCLIADGGISGCSIRRDGSLANSNWGIPGSRSYGVEIVTSPLDRLDSLEEVFDKITERGWSASGRAGLHIHVDATDFRFRDRLKLAHFAKRVEDVMLLFVKTQRYDGDYCKLLSPLYLMTMNDERFDSVSSMSTLKDLHNRYNNTHLPNTRYLWANIFSSHHPTIEFRMFHPIRSAEHGAKFAILVHNFVELVKTASHEQLEFIADSIDNEYEIEKKASMLLEALNIDFKLRILNRPAYASLLSKRERRDSAIIV